MAIFAPDLTQRAPRSPRVRLGGFVILPRMLDKARATIVKKNGEYHYDCPIDQGFLSFVGIDAKKLLKELAKGKSDTEILAWIKENAKHDRCPGSIYTWSLLQEQRTPNNKDARAYMSETQDKIAPKREDFVTWFDMLDIDDYVTYGGKA